jgi:diadenosine tetraphosphate (Ap4A) HIT family hydrolase
MSITVEQGVEQARAGMHHALICRVPSGWVVLCEMQYLSGYCIQLPDPVVPDLNALDLEQRTQYLLDMSMIGDVLMEVTGAYRINYAIMGNSDPALHAHIVPRYLTEPEPYRTNTPWSYPQEVMESSLFDGERDAALIARLADAIGKRVRVNGDG